MNDHVFLSVAVICRGDEPGLRGWLEGLAPADEVVLYCTHELPKDYPFRVPGLGLKLRVILGQWDNDFSKARNRCFSYATGEWVLWLDTDDNEVPGFVTKARAFLKDTEAKAVSAKYLYSEHEELYSTRAVRNGYGTWVGVVHEVLSTLEPPTAVFPFPVKHRHKTRSQNRASACRNAALAEIRYQNLARLQEPTPEERLEKALCALWMAEWEVVNDHLLDQAKSHYTEAYYAGAHEPDAALGLFRIALHRKRYWEAAYWARGAGRGLVSIPLCFMGYHDQALEAVWGWIAKPDKERIQHRWWRACVYAVGAHCASGRAKEWFQGSLEEMGFSEEPVVKSIAETGSAPV